MIPLLLLLLCLSTLSSCCEFRDNDKPPHEMATDSEIEIIQVTVFFSGADPDCSASLCPPPSSSSPSPSPSSSQFVYSSSSACGNRKNTWSLGNWQGGNGTYQDPVPLGSSVVGVSMELWGYWDYQSQSEGEAYLDNINVGHWISPLTRGESPCRNCMSSVRVPLCSSDVDWPHYTHGGMNMIRISPKSDDKICLSHVNLSLHVLVSPPSISQLVPPLGPDDGRTYVAVDSTNSLDDATNLRCRFGTNLVTAVLLNPHQALCGTPKTNSSEYTPVSVTEDGTYFSESLLFRYYDDPELVSLSPDTGTSTGGTLVTIRGSPFINASEYICESECLQCQWSVSGADSDSTGNLSAAALTPGTFFDSTTITCYTPPMSELLHSSDDPPPTLLVDVSVTQNGQIFTESTLAYTYEVEYVSWRVVTIVVGSVLITVAIITLLVFVALTRWKNPGDRPSDELLDVGYLTEGSQLLSRRSEHFETPDVDTINPSDLVDMTYFARGTFAEIYKAQWCGVEVAVKRLPFSYKIDSEKLKDLKKEAELMRQLRHPNVLLYLGTCFPAPSEDIWLVMEFLSCGSLFSLIHSNAELNFERIKSFCEDTAKGMLYLHTREPSILHRDLKSQNLLLDETWRVKVSDFGLSCTLRSPDQASCGTPAWSAPEVLRGSACTTQSDVYSFAIVVWELLSRAVPYEGKSGMEVVLGVSSKHLRPSFGLAVPPQWREFIMECWDENPNVRPSFDVILNRLHEM
mmetsp:Transcript_14728/g.23013  ORF Transcript_14728/g.23013 Transcript_14728/m.23013 type:complete len:743 (-) Transcript_14728:55-2283(-)